MGIVIEVALEVPGLSVFQVVTKSSVGGHSPPSLITQEPDEVMRALAAMAALLVYGRDEIQIQGGTPFLALMPIGYPLFLLLLFNLVIMSNPFFMLGRLMPYFAEIRGSLPTVSGWKIIAAIAWTCTAILALIPIKGIPFFVRFSWILSLACLPIYLFRRTGQIFIGGESIMMGAVMLALIFSLVKLLKARNVSLIQGGLGVCITLSSLICVAVLQRHSHAFEPFVDSKRPTPTQITGYLDDDSEPDLDRWRDSRVLIFGSPAAALYCIHNETTEKDRFIGNVDFNLNVVMEQIEAEQLHLLVPPDNGKFYPKGSFFSQVHARESQEDWLLFETAWNGWQLWRCVRSRPQPGSISE